MMVLRRSLSFTFCRAVARRRQAVAQGRAPDTVTLQFLLELHGNASLVVVLLILSVLTVTPLSGVGTVLSFAIFVIAWRWAHGGLLHANIPFESALRRIALNQVWGERTLRFLASLYSRANRWLYPRWTSVFETRWAPWWGVWIALMGAIIFLPLPLGNLLPSLSLVLLCLAWMFRDGLACLGSLLVGAAAIAYTAAFGQLIWVLAINVITWGQTQMGF
jgi:hypothetical protein